MTGVLMDIALGVGAAAFSAATLALLSGLALGLRGRRVRTSS